jgi:hypothetical protein
MPDVRIVGNPEVGVKPASREATQLPGASLGKSLPNMPTNFPEATSSLLTTNSLPRVNRYTVEVIILTT